MKAILYDAHKNAWAIKNVKRPISKLGEVLIKVTHAGLCGSDMHRINAPTSLQGQVILGHEISGTVEGSEKKNFLNKNVVVNPIIVCGECAPCKNLRTQFCENAQGIGKTRNGGFASHISVPLSNIYELPEGMNPQNGVLADGVAVIINAISHLGKQIPAKILVIGDGSVGALSLAVLRARYPESSLYLAGKNKKNIDVLRQKFGALEVSENDQYDVVFETVGRAQSLTMNTAIEKTQIGGTILVLGVYPENYLIDFNARSAFYKELSIIGVNSFVSSVQRDDFAEALNLICQNEYFFNELITHTLPLKEFSDGLDLMRTKTESGAIKIVFQP